MKKRKPEAMNWTSFSTSSIVRCYSTRRRLLLYLLGLLVVFTVVSSMYNIVSLSKSQKLAENSRYPVEGGILVEDRPPKSKKYCVNDIESGNFYINHFRDAVERLELELGRNARESEANQETSANSSNTGQKLPSEALVILDAKQSENGNSLIHLLEALRISYHKEIVRRGSAQSHTSPTFTTPLLTDVFGRPRYAVILFDYFDTYRYLSESVRNEIDTYCKTHQVGMILFGPARPAESVNGNSERVNEAAETSANRFNYPARFEPVTRRVVHFQLASRASLFKISKAGTHWTDERAINENEQPDAKSHAADAGHWAALRTDVTAKHQLAPFAFGVLDDFTAFVVAAYDRGASDGVERVLFGTSVDATWLHTLLIMDALATLTRRTPPQQFSAVLSLATERFVLVDIDDMFVAARGTRVTRADVEALLASQERIRNSGLVADFHFNSGYCGKFFEKGSDAENDGDRAIIENRAEFWWFDHSWSHFQPHLARNASQLLADANLNRQFAQKHGIVVDWQYAVAPHHSGVYPIHDPLYDAWTNMGVKVTSTEEYPHLRPARLRRGFVHNGVHVLPRQTCGLYTHTLRADELKDGFDNLVKMIEGGEVLQTIVLNPISVFMTHMPNYGSDRLGLFLFESLFDFIACNTNLRLRTVKPTELAERYFQLFPQDRDVVWTNPCDDNRHVDIWPSSLSHPFTDVDRFLTASNLLALHNSSSSLAKEPAASASASASSTSTVRLQHSCFNLPNVLIIGPQKSGTTALYTFLKQHPAISINAPANDTFEETQFFSNPAKYLQGGLPFYENFFENRLEHAIQSLFGEVLAESDSSLGNLRMAKLLEAKMAFLEKKWQLRLVDYGIDITNRTSLLNTPVETWNDLIDRVAERRSFATMEKSATYFDNEQTPFRIAQLLPRARLIAVLIDPVDRAYSWYQHVRSKLDPASNFSFSQILTVDFDESVKENDYLRDAAEQVWSVEQRRQLGANKALLHRVRQLRNRCLEPGHYATHLENWLRHFEANQLHIVDGKLLREQPVKAMQAVQKFLRLSPPLDYSAVLRFSEKKGFYCVVEKAGDLERVNCLGKSKGRAYAPLDTVSESYLRAYYAPHNAQLVKLLRRLRAAVPSWLQGGSV